jgi:hypothetical protein
MEITSEEAKAKETTEKQTPLEVFIKSLEDYSQSDDINSNDTEIFTRFIHEVKNIPESWNKRLDDFIESNKGSNLPVTDREAMLMVQLNRFGHKPNYRVFITLRHKDGPRTPTSDTLKKIRDLTKSSSLNGKLDYKGEQVAQKDGGFKAYLEPSAGFIKETISNS